jgi:MinD-like ATPase involved in chromosome partitioning or flagellar assembly
VTDRDNTNEYLGERDARKSVPQPPEREDADPPTPPEATLPPTFRERQWTVAPRPPGYRPGGPPQPGAERVPPARPAEEQGPPAGSLRPERQAEWSGPQAAPRADMPRGPRPEAQEWESQPPRPAPPAPPPPHWGETELIEQSSRWGEARAAQQGPANWSYVDQIRASELVRSRKIPPERGWRRALFKATFGMINLGQSPAERRQADLENKVRTLLRGQYKIGVLGKGGTGKTTMAACVGSLFAALRQDDRVVAIDADTAFGKLGSRVDPQAAGSYWELANDQHLYTFADVRSRVGNNAAGLFVLAGESSTSPRRRVVDPAVYREATTRLDNHFTISIIDCGSTLDAPITHEVVRDLDALMVVTSPWVDGASAAAQTMEWLANRGFTGLLHRTVVILNDSDGHADRRSRNVLRDQLGSRGQTVIEVPFDPHLRPGGVIDVDNELHRTTRRRILEIAASIAEHFPATSDRPRERR